MKFIIKLLLAVVMVVGGPAKGRAADISIATLNCYWFFNGDEGKASADKPTSTLEYSTKAGHLIGLLPREAPLFVGFQEIGGGEDLAAWPNPPRRDTVASIRLCSFTARTSTGQNVGAILDTPAVGAFTAGRHEYRTWSASYQSTWSCGSPTR